MKIYIKLTLILATIIIGAYKIVISLINSQSITAVAIVIAIMIVLSVIIFGITSESIKNLGPLLVLFGLFASFAYSEGTDFKKQALIQKAHHAILFDSGRTCHINNHKTREYVEGGFKSCFTKAYVDLTGSILELQKQLYLDPITGSVDTILNSPVKKKLSKDKCVGAVQVSLNFCPHLFNMFSDNEIRKINSF